MCVCGLKLQNDSVSTSLKITSISASFSDAVRLSSIFLMSMESFGGGLVLVFIAISFTDPRVLGGKRAYYLTHFLNEIISCIYKCICLYIYIRVLCMYIWLTDSIVLCMYIIMCVLQSDRCVQSDLDIAVRFMIRCFDMRYPKQNVLQICQEDLKWIIRVMSSTVMMKWCTMRLYLRPF